MTKKGYDSLKESYDYWCEREPARAHEWKRHFDWALARAQQYADKLGVDRDDVLRSWEEKRSYWYVNYYQDCNQPDIEKSKTPVMMQKDWMAKGKDLYGDDFLDWKFKCPQCGHVQSVREFHDAGIIEQYAAECCASRFPQLAYKNDKCKWTTGGLFKVGGVYVVNKEFRAVLCFSFADED